MTAEAAGSGPVIVCPSNPHFLEFQGRPIVLIASDHHYGAVIDADFDYGRYLEYMGRSGMNITRIYPGAMFEPPDKYVTGNPLGPLPGRQILPWARTDKAGANGALAEAGKPSLKFDLDMWNAEYFARLRDFADRAGRAGVIVEVAFFNGMYADCWPLMPMYHGNNIQGVGNYEAAECGLFTTADSRNREVMKYQAAYVAKIAAELNGFDNLIYDVCDEPGLAGKPDGSIDFLPEEKTRPWLEAMKDAFLQAERGLPKRHILGQTVQNLSPDMSGEAWCEWLLAEYVKPAGKALEANYAAEKPIVDVESDYYGHGLVKPYTREDVRLEGWWFMLGGGAGFINLNGEFHRGNETGGEDSRTVIVPQKKALRDFMESLDFARMRRYTGLGGLAEGATASVIAEEGRQYAVYLFHAAGDGQWGAHFVAVPGRYEREKVVLRAVSTGMYDVEWVNPATGDIVRQERIEHNGGALSLPVPPYQLDIALRMCRAVR